MKRFAAMLALLFAASLAFAIQPAETWTLGATDKYTQASTASYVTEGGNVTYGNLSGNVSTEKWAGFWGNVSGTIVLAPGANSPMFYTWPWTPADGGEVCAIAASSGFVWAAVEAVTGSEIDTVWGFDVLNTDSASNTLTDASCNLIVAGTTVAPSAGVTTNGGTFETCAVADAAVPAWKDDIAFCVNITQGGALFNSLTGDYQLLAAANETDAQYETYNFWLELD